MSAEQAVAAPAGLISAVILTRNEEANLPACLASLRGLADEIVVVDSGSTDRTAEIAQAAGARVTVHAFETQARQLNWALAEVLLRGEWILRLDADERVTPELAAELRATLPAAGADTTGCYFRRRVYFLGRWMRHGGYYPTWLLRVWRRGCADSDDRMMDEHMVLRHGRAAYLRHDIVEENLKGLSVWIDRQNRYASREAAAVTQDAASIGAAPSFFGPPEARRRWLKYRVYLAAPPFFRAFLYFLVRYVGQLGFLDGREGLIFHFLHGCWYRFLIDAKIYELRSTARDRPAPPPQSR